MSDLEINPLFSRKALVFAGCVVGSTALACLLVSLSGGLDALLVAAGAAGHKGEIAGIKPFVNTIQSNLIWIGVTAAGVAIPLLGLMFVGGHSRAQDYAMKGLLGMGILVGTSGIVA